MYSPGEVARRHHGLPHPKSNAIDSFFTAHSFPLCINPDSAVKPKKPAARCNPGADSLGSKRSSRLSRSKRFERFELFERIELHLLTKTHRLRCGRVVPRVSVDPN